MGKNNRARRAAKVKARVRRPIAGSRERMGSGPDAFSPAAFTALGTAAQLLRQNCSECGAPDLRWMTAADLPEEVSPGMRDSAVEGVGFYGSNAQAWLCGRCGGFGLLPA